MTREPVVLSWSGGKDSSLALAALRADPRYEVDAVFPLWGRDTRALAEEFVAAGFRAHLVCVDTTQLAASFAGRPFDAGLLAELPADVDPCGERGEFHTFVSAGPIFATPIPVAPGEAVLRDERFAYRDLLPVVTVAAGSGPRAQ